MNARLKVRLLPVWTLTELQDAFAMRRAGLSIGRIAYLMDREVCDVRSVIGG